MKVNMTGLIHMRKNSGYGRDRKRILLVKEFYIKLTDEFDRLYHLEVKWHHFNLNVLAKDIFQKSSHCTLEISFMQDPLNRYILRLTMSGFKASQNALQCKQGSKWNHGCDLKNLKEIEVADAICFWTVHNCFIFGETEENDDGNANKTHFGGSLDDSWMLR